MNRFAVRGGLICLFLLFAVTAFVAMSINAGETSKKIRIIYSNDLVGYVEPCG